MGCGVTEEFPPLLPISSFYHLVTNHLPLFGEWRTQCDVLNTETIVAPPSLRSPRSPVRPAARRIGSNLCYSMCSRQTRHVGCATPPISLGDEQDVSTRRHCKFMGTGQSAFQFIHNCAHASRWLISDHHHADPGQYAHDHEHHQQLDQGVATAMPECGFHGRTSRTVIESVIHGSSLEKIWLNDCYTWIISFRNEGVKQTLMTTF